MRRCELGGTADRGCVEVQGGSVFGCGREDSGMASEEESTECVVPENRRDFDVTE